jgi:arabinofuranan 3-O-arabinosyltransferase
MTSVRTSPGELVAPTRRLFGAVTVTAAVVSLLVAMVGAHALGADRPYDFGFYFRGGTAAWATGLPATEPGWLGTPFMAAVLAPITQVLSVRQGMALLAVVNLSLLVGACLVLSRVLAPMFGRLGALATAASTTVLFAPAVSGLWWGQFNIIAVALGTYGFVLARRGRGGAAGVLIGLSIALKPILVVVPVALLVRRATRRVGALAVGTALLVTVTAQAFLVSRGAPLASLQPMRLVRDATARMGDPAGSHACHPGNLSPQAFACRWLGPSNWELQRGLALLVAVATAAALLLGVRRHAATSFEHFGAAAAVSLLFGPIQWSHYQVALIPLLVVLVVRLAERPRAGPIVGMTMAYLGLASVWSPSMEVARRVAPLIESTPIHASFVLMRATAVAQALLLVVALLVLREAPRASAATIDDGAPELVAS